MTGLLFAGLAVLVLVAGVLARRRIPRSRGPRVTDDIVRRIETVGRVDAEDVDPLDETEIRAEEDEFWAQTWDEPEEL